MTTEKPLLAAVLNQMSAGASVFEEAANMLDDAADAVRSQAPADAMRYLRKAEYALSVFDQNSQDFHSAYLDSSSLIGGGSLLLSFRRAEEAALEDGATLEEAGGLAVKALEEQNPTMLRLPPDEFRKACLREEWHLQAVISGETLAQCAAVSALLKGEFPVPAVISAAVEDYLRTLDPDNPALPPKPTAPAA